MTLSIKDGDITVSVDVLEEDEQKTQSELLLIAAIKAIGCQIGGGNVVKAYYHIDPDVLTLRDDDDPLWQLYKKYNLLYYEHIAEK